MTDFNKLIEQAKGLKENAVKSREYKKISAIGISAGGEVKLTLNGEMKW